MLSRYNLPEHSGRRFLFGLFGRDHEPSKCSREGCVDCAIVVHFEEAMGAARERHAKIAEELGEDDATNGKLLARLIATRIRFLG